MSLNTSPYRCLLHIVLDLFGDSLYKEVMTETEERFADTFGGLGSKAMEAFKIAVTQGRLHRGTSGEQDICCRVSSVRSRIQLAVMRGVARQLLRRVGSFGY